LKGDEKEEDEMERGMQSWDGFVGGKLEEEEL
jgi:hypothetical protein